MTEEQKIAALMSPPPTKETELDQNDIQVELCKTEPKRSH